MGRTFKDKRKFDRKHDRNDGLKEHKKKEREPRPLDEDFDPYEIYEDEDYD